MDWDKILGGVLGAATGGLFSLAQPLISYGLGAFDGPKRTKEEEEELLGRPFVPMSQQPGLQLQTGSSQMPMPPLPQGIQSMLGGGQPGLPPAPQQSPWAAAAPQRYTPPPSQGIMNLTRYFGA